ncbi:uncharacterized protein LOC9649596 isoform X1 [Selaginella moellendorffii]|uniref:uncharacterized protein LOC9649596 isoform X1 n=1 Tax=Selaginella moellendorffii TaxID=88036 RepID=UPI000D1C6EFD|nr:uncharacterized protein LOC9649596 isoform X1 [Selaginella moellendorffii]|eukprot:XP_024540862.1 uncharacterized protein LOC9649596 isoform X1 [Selaginella moellendorffii]
MDYSLAAPKLLVSDLARASTGASAARSPITTIGALRFQRVWIQGVIVDWRGNSLALDDGSAIVELHFPDAEDKRSSKPGELVLRVLGVLDFFLPGMYMLIAGAYNPAEKKITVHKLVDLSSSPNAESFWSFEVIEAYHMFYKSQMDEPT